MHGCSNQSGVGMEHDLRAQGNAFRQATASTRAAQAQDVW